MSELRRALIAAETPRPDVLPKSTLEWAVILSARARIAGLAIHDRQQQGGS